MLEREEVVVAADAIATAAAFRLKRCQFSPFVKVPPTSRLSSTPLSPSILVDYLSQSPLQQVFPFSYSSSSSSYLLFHPSLFSYISNRQKVPFFFYRYVYIYVRTTFPPLCSKMLSISDEPNFPPKPNARGYHDDDNSFVSFLKRGDAHISCVSLFFF